LTTTESELQPHHINKLLKARSQDTVRSRSLSGKPCRMLRSAWTDAWEQPGAPKPLQMPLQGMLVAEARQRIDREAAKEGSGAQQLSGYFVGQVVGQLDRVRPIRQVMAEMVAEYAEAIEIFADQFGTVGS
jgi:NAD(P)H-dependent flavin oxidoreductase YrpB (nitropropane dioxygenase family)